MGFNKKEKKMEKNYRYFIINSMPLELKITLGLYLICLKLIEYIF